MLAQVLKSTHPLLNSDPTPNFVRLLKICTFATVEDRLYAGGSFGPGTWVDLDSFMGVFSAGYTNSDNFMRIINKIIIHATGNTADSKITLADIRHYHITKGWRDIGYHYVVFADGRVERGRPISVAGAHCYGHNAHSIGVAYVGGIGKDGRETDTRTAAQKQALLQLVTKLVKMYRCDVYGHRDLSPDKNHDGVIEPWEFIKMCPCFDAHAEYHNIYLQMVSF